MAAHDPQELVPDTFAAGNHDGVNRLRFRFDAWQDQAKHTCVLLLFTTNNVVC